MVVELHNAAMVPTLGIGIVIGIVTVLLIQYVINHGGPTWHD